MSRKKRFDVKVGIKRGKHDFYFNVYNRQPVKPGKVSKVFQEAIDSTMRNVTRNKRYAYTGFQSDGFFFAFSPNEYSNPDAGGVLVMVEVLEV